MIDQATMPGGTMTDRKDAPPAGGASRPPEPAAIRPRDPEVVEKPKRRVFAAEYKLRILAEADACTQPGELGALLRREGLYSSNLSCWRRQRNEGVLRGLSPTRRGRKAKPNDPRDTEIRQLRKEAGRLRRRIEEAERIIEFQKKVSELLEIPLRTLEDEESDS